MAENEYYWQEVGRRTVLRGASTSMLVGFADTVSGRHRSRRHHASRGERDDPAVDVQPSEGNGAICELDLDERFQTEMHLVRDPASRGRDEVLHVTSNRTPTRDYACSVLTLTTQPLSLTEVTNNQLTFDYYEGRHNANAAPDEVFLIVQTEEGLFITFQHLNTDGERRWQTYDVAGAIQGRGPSWTHKRILPEAFNVEGDVDLSTVDFSSFDVDFSMRIIEQILQFLQNLRDQGDTISSPFERYGRDATMLAVALGKGFTTQTTVNDIFYDDLVYTTSEETMRFKWPVALAMRFQFLRQQITPASDQTVRARLTFTQPQRGLSIEDINTDSVVVTPYTSIAPLEDIRGVTPASVTFRGNQLRLTFDVTEIEALVTGTEPTLLLTGTFDDKTRPRPVSFLGRDTLRFRNPA